MLTLHDAILLRDWDPDPEEILRVMDCPFLCLDQQIVQSRGFFHNIYLNNRGGVEKDVNQLFLRPNKPLGLSRVFFPLVKTICT